MSRQHAKPVLLGPGAAVQTLQPLSLGTGPDQISEAELQALLHENPACLPIGEVDPLFLGAIPICRELTTRAGPIDNLLITPTGLPVLVECKLWRNPEGRREVVGQILDYAKELSRWSASDLQREVSRRLQRAGNPILELLREAGHDVDEIAFNDALTYNLRRGRFLLLIVGDGIREGVEAIAEYLQAHAGLHFSLGLVELPIYVAADKSRLVVPRILARTQLITRIVVQVPDGQAVIDNEALTDTELDDEDPASRINFWKAFVAGLKFDDPEQLPPKPTRQGSIYLTLPVSGGDIWITIYRAEAKNLVGLYLSYAKDSLGSRIVDRIIEDWPAIQQELGGDAHIEEEKNKSGRRLIIDRISTGSWLLPSEREVAFVWLRKRANDFVNVLRPRVKAIAADIERES